MCECEVNFNAKYAFNIGIEYAKKKARWPKFLAFLGGSLFGWAFVKAWPHAWPHIWSAIEILIKWLGG